MENNQELLVRLEQHSRKQLLFTQILCALFGCLVICTLVLVICITGMTNEVLALAAPLQEVTTEVQEIATQAQTVMEDLGTVAEALAAADLGAMVEQVNSLAADSQNAVSDAMKKLDTVDIVTLNKAIQDLAAVVEPLARVSSIFG